VKISSLTVSPDSTVTALHAVLFVSRPGSSDEDLCLLRPVWDTHTHAHTHTHTHTRTHTNTHTQTHIHTHTPTHTHTDDLALGETANP